VADISGLWDFINLTDSFAKQMNRTMALFWEEIYDAVIHTEQYAKKPNPRDLHHFAELVYNNVNSTPIKMAAQNVMDGFASLISANEFWTSPYDSVPVDHANGITIWLYDGTLSEFNEYKNLDYAKLSFWDEFLAAYKASPARPDVPFDVNYTLSDSDLEGNQDTITLDYTSEGAGLDVVIEVFNYENNHVLTLYTNNTQTGTDYSTSFNPSLFGLPSDYYNFYMYLENESGVPQNYSEVVNNWLGNERPDLVLRNVTVHRLDGTQIGRRAGKSAIDGENTLIKAVLANEGNNALTGIIVDFYEGDNLIGSESLDLDAGTEMDLIAHWFADQGERTISVIVDGNNTIKEIDEGNNEAIETVEVKSTIPVDSLIMRGKIFNKDKINIIGASVTIRNLRTNETINRSTGEKGYKATLEPEWFIEGDEIEISAKYNSVKGNITVLAYSEEGTIWGNITLKTELYDGLFYFKLVLIIIEIIGFILVINYVIRLRRYRSK
jgi:hypothetical protein